MKTLLVFSCILLLGLFSGCGMKDSASSQSVKDNAPKTVIYTCPMHPEVEKTEAGKCPKCGMDLVLKK